LIPEKQRGSLHMTYLQNISLALLNEEFVKTILNTSDINELFKVINQAIMHKENENTNASSTDSKGLIVGISACATGVAHTYMAREALEKHGKDVGYDV
jgi:PTS system fructose-specific IIC component